MSTGISSGRAYQILTNYHTGGSVSLNVTRSSYYLWLADDANSDPERWVFYAADEPNTFAIQSYSRPSSYAREQSPFFKDATLDKDPTMWYLQQVGDIDSGLDPQYNYRICTNSTCLRYWVPSHCEGAFRTDACRDKRTPTLPWEDEEGIVRVTLRTEPYRGEGFEFWQIRLADRESNSPSPVTNQPTTPSPSSSSGASSPASTSPRVTTTEFINPEESKMSTNAAKDQLDALKKCAPCGSTECSFTPSGEPKEATYSILIGQPVSNCAQGSRETTTTKLGGTFQLQRSWNVEVSVSAGFEFLGASVSSTVTAETGVSKILTQTQEVEVSIPPGQVGALVANVSYSTQLIDVGIDDSTLAFVSIQPELVLGYSVVYADCSANFKALTVPKVECDESGALPSHRVSLISAKMLIFWTFLFAMGTLIT